MSDVPKLESILSVAMEHERNHDWVEAVQFCEKALGLKPKDFFETVQVQERIGAVRLGQRTRKNKIDQKDLLLSRITPLFDVLESYFEAASSSFK
jgi:hypothetical protein